MSVAKVNVANAIGKAELFCSEAAEKLAANAADISTHISLGNSKMGPIPSFSVYPVVTCGKGCKECRGYCYGCKGHYVRGAIRRNMAENTVLVRQEPDRVIGDINAFMQGKTVTYNYFRFNVTGDIWCAEYWRVIAEVCKSNPATQFMVFTKQYARINAAYERGEIPENLTIVFSQWGTAEIENPHGLPVAITKLTDDQPVPARAHECAGNCAECLKCFTAAHDEIVTFNLH